MSATKTDRTIFELEVANAVLAVLAVVVTHLVAGPGPFLTGVLVGAVLSIANLRAMVFLGHKVLHAEKRGRAFYGILFTAKVVILMTVIWLLLSNLNVLPLGFLIGFSTVLPAALVITVKRSLAPAAAPQKREHQL